MSTTKAQPGEWYLVEGKPFQVPFIDRLGTAIKVGDEVLYARGGKLVLGRLITLREDDQIATVRDCEQPNIVVPRPTSEVVLDR